MKKITLLVLSLAFPAMPARAERPRLEDREAPRATDLLHAQKLADQARKRLEMPAHRTGGWKNGGTGWGEDDAPGAAEPREVIINLNRSRARRRTQP
jgi:hypothetical protein